MSIACGATVRYLNNIFLLFCTLDTGSCSNDGEIRLVNGLIEQEGRAEICLNGIWGAICQTGWSRSDASVFCKGLGYYGQGMHIFISNIIMRPIILKVQMHILMLTLVKLMVPSCLAVLAAMAMSLAFITATE